MRVRAKKDFDCATHVGCKKGREYEIPDEYAKKLAKEGLVEIIETAKTILKPADLEHRTS